MIEKKIKANASESFVYEDFFTNLIVTQLLERRGRGIKGAVEEPERGGEGRRGRGRRAVRGLRPGRTWRLRRWQGHVGPLPPPHGAHVVHNPRPPRQGEAEVLPNRLPDEHHLDCHLLLLHGLVGHSYRGNPRNQVSDGILKIN